MTAPAQRRKPGRHAGLADAPRTARLSRADWIDAAIVKLAEDNVDALRVDELAERLGVTKGSFYWHFDSREALLAAALESWRAMMTGGIQQLITHLPGTPWDWLARLLQIAISPRPDVPGGPFELTLRDWARRDPEVNRIVREVDDVRVAFLVELYRAAGLQDDAAHDYAHAQMAYTIGDRMTVRDHSRAELERRRRIAEALFLPRHLGSPT